MSKPTRPVVIPHYDEIEAARTLGRSAARQFVKTHAPKNPVLRVAWCGGLRSVDLTILKETVTEARVLGVSWQTIGNALSIAHSTARARFQGDLAGRVKRSYIKKKAAAIAAQQPPADVN